MEAASSRVYMGAMGLNNFTPVQFMTMVRKAVKQLQWRVVYAGDDVIECLTTDNEPTEVAINVLIRPRRAEVRGRAEKEDDGNGQTVIKYMHTLGQAIVAQMGGAGIANQDLPTVHREKYGALLLSKSYVVTPLLIYLNVLVFVVMVLAGVSFMQPTAGELYAWGGNFRFAATHGEWWRLITYQFLHGGVMHLLMNMLALLYIGMFLEPLMGRLRFASAYLLTGVCAGLMSIAVHGASVGVGASGAIFGMYGVFLSLLSTRYIKKTIRKTMLRSILFFVLLNLLSGLQGNTDNAAHIGGLLGGIVIGYSYYSGIVKEHTAGRQWLTTAVIAVLMVVTVGGAVWFMR